MEPPESPVSGRNSAFSQNENYFSLKWLVFFEKNIPAGNLKIPAGKSFETERNFFRPKFFIALIPAITEKIPAGKSKNSGLNFF
jgi:hypothetical protein